MRRTRPNATCILTIPQAYKSHKSRFRRLPFHPSQLPTAILLPPSAFFRLRYSCIYNRRFSRYSGLSCANSRRRCFSSARYSGSFAYRSRRAAFRLSAYSGSVAYRFCIIIRVLRSPYLLTLLSVSPYMQGHFPDAFEHIPVHKRDLSQSVSYSGFAAVRFPRRPFLRRSALLILALLFTARWIILKGIFESIESRRGRHALSFRSTAGQQHRNAPTHGDRRPAQTFSAVADTPCAPQLPSQTPLSRGVRYPDK